MFLLVVMPSELSILYAFVPTSLLPLLWDEAAKIFLTFFSVRAVFEDMEHVVTHQLICGTDWSWQKSLQFDLLIWKPYALTCLLERWSSSIICCLFVYVGLENFALKRLYFCESSWILIGKQDTCSFSDVRKFELYRANRYLFISGVCTCTII